MVKGISICICVYTNIDIYLYVQSMLLHTHTSRHVHVHYIDAEIYVYIYIHTYEQMYFAADSVDPAEESEMRIYVYCNCVHRTHTHACIHTDIHTCTCTHVILAPMGPRARATASTCPPSPFGGPRAPGRPAKLGSGPGRPLGDPNSSGWGDVKELTHCNLPSLSNLVTWYISLLWQFKSLT